MWAIVDQSGKRSQRQRWIVHLWLMTTFVVALLTLLARMSVGLHAILGLLFAGLVWLHLRQRKNRIRSLLTNLTSWEQWFVANGRLAWSDLILFFIFLNLMVSGILDYVSGGRGIFVNLGFKPIRWHSLSAILLMAYLLVHVIRRRKRLRRSRVN